MIESELKFLGVFGQVLLGDMHVSPIDRPLEMLPKILKPVYMAVAANIFLRSVFDRLMRVTQFAKSAIRSVLIRVTGGTRLDVFGNVRNKRASLSVENDFRHHFPAALQHPLNLSLARRSKARLARMVSPHVGFIDFNVATQGKLAVNIGHVLADEPGHAPRGLIGHAKLAFEFLCWNPMTGRGEQIKGIKPELQRCARILKRSSGGRVDVMPAPLAGECPFGLESIPSRRLGAFRAGVALTISRFKNVFEAFFIRGERLMNSRIVMLGFSLSTICRFIGENIANQPPYVKGIIP
jgi:hypothetical protein